MYKSLNEALISNSISDNAGITFISSEDKEIYISYKALYNKSLEYLYCLQQKGIGIGDELIFQIEDNEKFIYLYWACLLGKIIPIPVSVGNNDEHRMKVFKIWRILNNPYIITTKSVFQALDKYSATICETSIIEEMKCRKLLVEEINTSNKAGTVSTPDLNDIAFIQFSSGSTGEPKGVILTHENVLTNVCAAIECSGTTSSDSMLSWMPLTHDMGMIGFHLLPLVANSNQFIMPTSLFIRRPTLWMIKANQHKITVTSSPNFGYKYFLTFFKPEIAHDWDLSNIRIIYNGAEPISPDLCNEFLNTLSEYGLRRSSMFTVYGMAEATVAVAFPEVGKEFESLNLNRNYLSIGDEIIEVQGKDKNAISFVKLGYPVTDCFLRICDCNDHILPEKVIGNVQICGKNVTRGYYNNEKATETLFTEDGWLKTGDLGLIHNGSLIITGRAKDIIFVNGQNYYPHDIERISEAIEGISLGEVAACGVLNTDNHQDEIIIFVIFKKDLDKFVPLAETLKKLIYNKMGIEIKHVIPIKKFPKTTSGKIQRYKLGERYTNGEFDEIKEILKIKKSVYDNMRVTDRPHDEVEINLYNICKSVFGDKEIGINDSFLELGGTSIQLSRISMKVEEMYPNLISITDFYAYPTIAQLAKYIKRDIAKTITSIQLPEEFFIKTGKESELTTFRYELDNLTYKTLRSQSETADLSSLLLSVFIYVLSKVSGMDKICVQTLLNNENSILPVNISMGGMTELDDLVRNINQELKLYNEEKTIKINNLRNMRINRMQNSIVPFIYKKNMLRPGTQLQLYFDFIIEIDESVDKLILSCNFNYNLLEKEYAKKIFEDFIRILKMISRDFEKKGSQNE